MNTNIIEAHLELHRHIMAVIKERVPKTHVGTFKETYTLDEISTDDEGTLVAKYSRYEGCGQYEHETVYLNVRALFPEEA